MMPADVDELLAVPASTLLSPLYACGCSMVYDEIIHRTVLRKLIQ